MSQKEISQIEQGRWKAVEKRDRCASGAFYYAVVSTGIYCRPGCSSRLPRRENIVFFETAVEAEEAGYRACRKCRPNGTPKTDTLRQIMIQACRRLEQSAYPVKLEALAAKAEMSPHHFQRRFKAIVGVTPKQYELQYRADRFRDELNSARSVTEALYAAGYGSGSTVYDKNQDQLAMQPKVFKKGGAGEHIIYGTLPCSLGWLLVAATERGICAIELGDDPELLVRGLEKRLNNAGFSIGGSRFLALIGEVVAHVADPGAEFNLPLDIRGTAFQRRVWQVLRTIKSGETRSYSDIAEQLDAPAAVRAVARACASNPLAVVIPCHRVLRKDGNLSGYRWGIARKKLLLESEKHLNRKNMKT